jgi:TRAP-type transport system periplasmic protein
MNQRRYDSLPDTIRDCIDRLSGDVLIERFGDWWNAWDEPGRVAAEARGNEISVLSDAERERWREALTPMIEAYLDQLEAEGVDNAREIYQAMQDRIAELEG